MAHLCDESADQADRVGSGLDLNQSPHVVDVGAGAAHDVCHAGEEAQGRIVAKALEPMGGRSHASDQTSGCRRGGDQHDPLTLDAGGMPVGT
jgi:hypothetical protein